MSADKSIKKFVWNENLETGIDKIDEQHKSLVELINTLQNAIIEKDQKIIGEVIKELLECYIVVHFRDEEKMMEEANYPQLESHKNKHKQFVSEIHEYQKRFESGEDIATELNNMLVRWLFNHISNTDQQYVSILHLHISKQNWEKEKNTGKKKSWLQKLFHNSRRG